MPDDFTIADLEVLRAAAMTLHGFNHGELAQQLTEISRKIAAHGPPAPQRPLG